MKKKIVLLAAVLSGVLFSGCGTTAKFVYPARMDSLVKVASSPVYDKKIAVLPFDDFRKSDNSTGTLLLAYLPLMPWGWVDYGRPDAARSFITLDEFNFTPAEDLPKAAAVSLRRSNLFKDAFFSFGGEKDNADFVMYGEIRSTKYLGRLYSYGLSFFGSYLWLIGAPAGTSYNTLALYLYLKKKNEIIWEYNFNRTESVWHWYYAHWGRDVIGYSELMQQCMNEAIVDLAKRLKENPALLK